MSRPGRKPLSIWEKERKPEFEKILSGYSLTGLQNVIDIANNSFDQKLRLHANIWLLEKTIGRDYVFCRSEQEQENRNIVINVIPVGTDPEISPEDAELIKRAEAGEQSISLKTEEDSESWDDIDEWENDVYDPE